MFVRTVLGYGVLACILHVCDCVRCCHTVTDAIGVFLHVDGTTATLYWMWFGGASIGV